MKKRKKRKRKQERHTPVWTIGCMLAVFIFFTIIPLLYCGGVATEIAMKVISKNQSDSSKGDEQASDSQGKSKSKSKKGKPGGKGKSSKDGDSPEDHENSEGITRGGSRKEFRPWKGYKIALQSEKGTRLVVGRKHSITYKIRIKPLKNHLPDAEQLAEISERFQSDNHHMTNIYFYVPGMDIRRGAWATAHYLPDRPFEVNIFNSVLPEIYEAN